MELVFVYYNNLSFDQIKRFMLEFSDGGLLEGVFFFLKKKKKNKDCYITSMLYYVDLTVDVKILPQFDKIKAISDRAKAILADGVDFGYKKKLCKQCLMERAMHLKLINKPKLIRRQY